MSAAPANRVLREAPYTAYIMLASVLSIACFISLFRSASDSSTRTGPLIVLGDIASHVSGRPGNTLAPISDWLQAAGGTVSVIAVVAFIIGLVYFAKERKNTPPLPVWFGAPAAFVGLAGLWEVHPRWAVWVGFGCIAVFFIIAAVDQFTQPICTRGGDPVSFSGHVMMNWLLVVAFIVLAPLAVVADNWPRRSTGSPRSPCKGDTQTI